MARRRRLAIIIVGCAAYVIAMIATLPARFAVAAGPGETVTGTIWNGALAQDGRWRIEWRWSPGRSMAALAFAADVRIVGAGTDLAGSMTVWPGSRRLEDLTGTADAALLAVPDHRCEGPIELAGATILLAGAASTVTGEARADALRCASPSATAPAELPPLTIRAVILAGRSRIDIAPVGRARLTLVEGGIVAGRLQLAPTPAGIALLPALRGLRIDAPL